jgi:hypothetical protein
MTYFFRTTYQGFRRGQSRKSEDCDQNTKSGLKSSVLGFINQETAQNDHNKVLYMIWRWKKFHDLNPFGDRKLCDHFAMVTWEFIERIAPSRNLPYEVFFVQLWYINVLSEKKPECIMGSCDSTGFWSWQILTFLTKITIFGHRFLSNKAFIKYNGMRFGKPYTWCSK